MFTVVVARLLSPSEAGLVFLFIIVSTGISTLIRGGTDFLGLNLGATSSNLKKDSRFIAQLMLIIFGFVLFVFLTIQYVTNSGLGLPGFNADMIFLLFLTAFAQSIVTTFGALLRSSGHVTLGTAMETGSYQLLSLFGILFVNEYYSINASKVAMIYFISLCFIALITVFLFRIKQSNTIIRPENYDFTFKSFIKINWKILALTTGASFLFYINTLAPALILGIFSSPEEVSFLAISQRLTSLIVLLPALQIAATGPIAARYMHNDKSPQLNIILRKQIIQSLMFALPFAAMLVLFPSKIIDVIFGANYREATATLVILASGYFLILFSGNVLSLMQITKASKAAFAIAATGGVVWLIFGSTIAVRFGASGVALTIIMIGLCSGIAGAYFLSATKGIKSYPFLRKSNELKGES
jgi:O-antigen/teichoic acid export membrane protein